MARDEELYDDLSRLNNELVNLQRELAKKNIALETARSELERRVEERTADLRDANLRLREEIEERRRIEAESQRLRAELTHANRIGILGVLAAAIAHETNQPLAAMLNNAQAALRLLRQGSPDLGEVREALEEIVADDKRAAAVIDRLRSMAKKDEVHRAPYDLNAVVGDVLHLLRSEAAFQRTRVTEDLDPAIPELHGDPVQIQQVVLNLLLNALQAMEDEDEDARHVVLTTRGGDRGGVSLSVADSGPGLDPEIVESAFEPFVTTKSHGMGLGLALCRTIVEGQGGHLRAENRPEGGARISFWLPVGREV
jgi:C4-dicarboxylate-specific signal transduction histidine kinase